MRRASIANRHLLMITLICLLMALVMPQSSSAAYLSVANDPAAPSQFTITLNQSIFTDLKISEAELELKMELQGRYFIYRGNLLEPIPFEAPREGQYAILLSDTRTQQEIEALRFSYPFIPVNPSNSGNPDATSASPSANASQDVSTQPLSNASVSNASASGVNLTTANITGSANISDSGISDSGISGEKGLILQVIPRELAPGQTAFITVSGMADSDSLQVVMNDTVYRYLGEMDIAVTFVPHVPGDYSVEIRDSQDNLLRDVTVMVVAAQDTGSGYGFESGSAGGNASQQAPAGNEVSGNADEKRDALKLMRAADGNVTLQSILENKRISFKNMRQSIENATMISEEEKLRRLHAVDLLADVEQRLQLSGVDNLPLWIHDSSGSVIDADVVLVDESGIVNGIANNILGEEVAANATNSTDATNAANGTVTDDMMVGGAVASVASIENVASVTNEVIRSDSVGIQLQLQNLSSSNGSGALKGGREIRSMTLRPRAGAVKEVSFEGVNMSSPVALGLEELFDATPPPEIQAEDKTFIQGYAIDPSLMNFSSGAMTVEAQGTELYKCRDWDFGTQSCFGAWQKVMDITPGQNYTIELSAADPGYGEAVPIPSGGWIWSPGAGELVGIYLCSDMDCVNTSTNFRQGDTVYMRINNSADDLRTNTINVFDVFQGAVTDSIYNGAWYCVSGGAPYTTCTANFTIDEFWDDGWYYIDADLDGTTGGADHHSFETAFTVNVDNLSIAGDSLKFFSESTFTVESDEFPEGSTVYLQFNITTPGVNQTITTATSPRFMSFQAGATGVTETIIRSTPPYRISFTFPNLGNNYWYYLQPRLRNSTGGAVPEGADIFGRMIRDRANNIPILDFVNSTSNYSWRKSVGESIFYTVNLTDRDETHYHRIFICSTNAATVYGCSATTICSSTGWSLPWSMNCTRTALRSDLENVTSYAFVCDPFSCSTSRAFSWSVYNDSRAPSVALQEPVNNLNPPVPFPYLDSLTVLFSYIPIDDYGMANCTLYTNATGSWAPAVTNYSITNNTFNYMTYKFPRDGFYIWNVQCMDYAGNRNVSMFNYTLAIQGPPVVTLRSPPDGGFSNSLTQTFNYNVTYSSNVSNCSLYINDIYNMTNDTITRNVPQNFTLGFSGDGTFNWSVVCMDNASFTGFSDNWSMTLDTTPPIVNPMSPSNWTVWNSSIVPFTFNASDLNDITCVLYVDEDPYETFLSVPPNTPTTSMQIMPNGVYPWYMYCVDGAGNSVTSGTYYINISANDSDAPRWYETDYTARNYTSTAYVNLSFQVDGKPGNITKSISGYSGYVMADTVSSMMGSNGIYIKAGERVNFSAAVRRRTTGGGSPSSYVSWHVLRINGTDETEICSYGNDWGAGARFQAATRTVTVNGTCVMSSMQRLMPTEQIGLKVHIYNSGATASLTSHFIDNLSSFMMLNFTRLGFLTTDLISPGGNLIIRQNTTFPIICQYRCSQGSCIDVKIYAQYNSTVPASLGWRNISNTTNLVLNGTETNPHTFPLVTQGTYNTTFWVKGTNFSYNNIRCFATSNFTNPSVGNTTRAVNVTTYSAPSITLLNPANKSYQQNNVTFYYIPSSAFTLINCSLIINGLFNQTNLSVTNNFQNNFTVRNFPEGSYSWRINCTDAELNQGQSLLYTFNVDQTPPLINLTMPIDGMNFTTSTIRFNFTANDSVVPGVRCNVTLDGNKTVIEQYVNIPTKSYSFVRGNLTIGDHYWNVTCIDNASNANTSATFRFNITDLPPVVSLNWPPAVYWTNNPDIVLYYNYTAATAASNCSLFINNTFNMSNQSAISNGLLNNFTFQDLADGRYIWNVTCRNTGGLAAAGINRTFYIDTVPPRMNLSFPAGIISVFNILFNFTAFDNMATGLLCNLSYYLDTGYSIQTVHHYSNASVFNETFVANTNWATWGADGSGIYYETGDATRCINDGNDDCLCINDNSDTASEQVSTVSDLNLSACVPGTITVRFGKLYDEGTLEATDCFTLYASNNSGATYSNVGTIFCNDVVTTTMTLNLSGVYANGYAREGVRFRINASQFGGAGEVGCLDNILVNCTIDNPTYENATNHTYVQTNVPLNAFNGVPKTYMVYDVPEGTHSWNVSCVDNASNYNISTNVNFTVYAPPIVTLIFPQNNYFNNTANLSLIYNVSENSALANCSLFMNGEFNQTNTSNLTNGVYNNFTFRNLAEGYYNWSVLCFDNSGLNSNMTWRNFTIDTTRPNIVPIYPPPYEVIRALPVTFNFTAYDNMDGFLTCTIYIDDVAKNPQNIQSPNGTVMNVTVAVVTDGAHHWYANCTDDAGNKNGTGKIYFNMSGPPQVQMITPTNRTWVNTMQVSLTYKPYHLSGIANCSLYFDGVYNQSVAPANNNVNNNFTVTVVEQIRHNWSVICWDNTGGNATGGEYWFGLDYQWPSVQLNDPSPGMTWLSNYVNFNFTAWDNIAANLTCNITVNMTNVARINAPNGTATNYTVPLHGNTNYTWNVTCNDSAYNFNYSETWDFSIYAPPHITLNNPPDGSVTQATVVLFYTPSDAFGFLNCSLYVNGLYNQSNSTPVRNRLLNNFTLLNVSQGPYDWQINCTDVDYESNLTDPFHFSVNVVPPSISLVAPPNATFPSFEVPTITFNWSAYDDNSTEINCSVRIDNVIRTNQTVMGNPGNSSTNVTGFRDGVRAWNVTCYDSTGNFNTSLPWYFNVSIKPYIVLGAPANDTWNNTGSITFSFTPTDNDGFSNCTVFIDGVINETNYLITNATLNHINVTDLQNGMHNWSIGCYDNGSLNNYNSTDVRWFTIDRTVPAVILYDPLPNQSFNYSNIMFNWTFTDNLAGNATCNLSLDGASPFAPVTAFNNTPINRTVANIVDGLHWWNVTCRDFAGNLNISETRNFSIIQPPNVTLYSPANGGLKNTSDVIFSYIPSDNSGNFSNCTLILDGGIYAWNYTIFNAVVNNITGAGIPDGPHTWSVNCTDLAGSESASLQTRNVTIDTMAPYIILYAPLPDQWFNYSNILFNWTFIDNLQNNASCNLTLDGSSPFPASSAVTTYNNTPMNRTVPNVVDGTHWWNVTCRDFANNTNISVTRNFTVQEIPNITLVSPPNNVLKNTSNVTFTYLPRDNSQNFSNCSLILDGSIYNTTYVIFNSTINNITGLDISEGRHEWTINCTDEHNNTATATSPLSFFNVTIDITPPNINLSYPGPDQMIYVSYVNFNFTAMDYLSVNITCNLTIDGTVSAGNSNLHLSNSTPYNKTITNFDSGAHNWSVTCWDWVNNTNISEMRNFTMPAPDFEINMTHISFSNINPNHDSNISINATIFNVGGGVPSNISVQFWDGDPATGIMIGNRTISQLIALANTTISMSWNISLGLHEIWILVDPLGDYSEGSELNNDASRNISTLFANITAPANGSWSGVPDVAFTFLVANYTGGSLDYTFFVDGARNESGAAPDNAPQVQTITLTEGTHRVLVEADDYGTRKKNSSLITIFVDLNPPVTAITTPNQSWFRNSTPNITFTITDTMETALNYTFYANGTINVNGTLSPPGAGSTLLDTLADGIYLIVLESYDRMLHYANSTPITIFIDTTPPNILLNSPAPVYSLYNNNSARLNFTAYDNLDMTLTCNVTFDSTVRATIEAGHGVAMNWTVNGIVEGSHAWNITCKDNATNINTSETRAVNVFISPNVTLVSPANGTWSSDATQTFVFHVNETTGLSNCSIYLNGTMAATKTGDQLQMNGQNNFTLSGLGGAYNWSVECYDNTTAFMFGNTTYWLRYVDLLAPNAAIRTANNTAFNTTTPMIEFNMTDNMASLLNYTLFANGTIRSQGIINSSQTLNATLSALPNDGYYEIMVEGRDIAGNRQNSTPIIILVDTTGPYINLTAPPNGSTGTSLIVPFNFTATDRFSENLTCNVTISGYGYVDINATSGVPVEFTRQLPSGIYYWNVTCYDQLRNRNTSLTYNFMIPLPDLTLNSTGIMFSTNNPKEGENITINATIWNIGTIPSYNFSVRFLMGDPQNGTQIGIDVNVSQLDPGNLTTVEINWSAMVGTTMISVFADSPFPNGTVLESNETNNWAFTYITVGNWHFVGGTAIGELKLQDFANFSAYAWGVSNFSRSNLYVTKEGAVISWTRLKALSRNATGAYRLSDFEVLDQKLNMTYAPDSVNRTFTSLGLPKSAMNITVYGKSVNDVPMANSTNVSSFMTGVLWDTADGNTSYNGSQDVVFMTQFNPGQIGFNGTFDYEIRIPAKLRSYNGAGDTVTFYLELK